MVKSENRLIEHNYAKFGQHVGPAFLAVLMVLMRGVEKWGYIVS